MPISLDPNVHYVTQSSCYANAFLGPLTNRKIAKYKKLGYYGEEGILAKRKENARKKAKAKVPKKTSREELRKLYVF